MLLGLPLWPGKPVNTKNLGLCLVLGPLPSGHPSAPLTFWWQERPHSQVSTLPRGSQGTGP